LPKPKKIQIGDWVRIRKIGINGVYQVMDWNEDGTLIVEQDDRGYKHRMKVTIEEVIK
tara:strand:- start:2790 stop:2963 length:174 start_codon:yes stop_codon:yes gene_type:complete